MLTILRVAGLAWGDAMMDATFFIVQTYLTQVWKLNFASAASLLNIWGGIYRILPFFFLFLADTTLGNQGMLALSGSFSTMGLMLITVSTATPLVGLPCDEKDDGACGEGAEKLIFLIGMAAIALGRAARFASTDGFLKDQNGHHGSNLQKGWLVITGIIFFATPFAGIFVFPYVRKWYVLFGTSTICTSSALIFFWSGRMTYEKLGPRADGSPVTDIARVFVAAVFVKRSLPFPKDDEVEVKLYATRDEQYQKLSRSRILRFLHKAAIIADDDRDAESGEVKKRSWRVCSVSEVESTKIMIRLIPMWINFLICGVVSSIGNTYLVEQMSHMKLNIGVWNAPPQVILLIFIIFKYLSSALATSLKIVLKKNPVARDGGAIHSGYLTLVLTVICCAVAAAVESRRLHEIRRHQTEVAPMSAFWLIFPFVFLALIDIFFEFALSRFHGRTPKSMKRYRDCLSEGVVGYGYICGALSVFDVTKIRGANGKQGWLQDDLNASRLDFYYWILTAYAAMNLIFFFGMDSYWARERKLADFDEEADADFEQETALELFGIKKSSALGIILLYFPGVDNFLGSVLVWGGGGGGGGGGPTPPPACLGLAQHIMRLGNFFFRK